MIGKPSLPSPGVSDAIAESAELLEAVGKYADGQVAPQASRIDAEGSFPRDIFDAGIPLGLTALRVPRRYEGLEADLGTILMVLERIGRASAACAGIFATYGEVVQVLLHGSEPVREEYLPKIASGELVPCFALAEPGAGSDAGAISTTCRRDGRGYVLNGRKTYVSNGSVGGIYVVVATSSAKGGQPRPSAFVVPRDAPGLEVGQDENLSGLRGCPVTEVTLDEVRVPASALLGGEGEAGKIINLTLDEARLTAAAISLGIARAATEAAIVHAGDRHQFGKAIISFQGVGFKLAAATTELAAGWALTDRATTAFAAGDRDAPLLAAMAKVFTTDVAMRAATDAVQVFGGVGLSRDLPIERYMRDAKVFQIVDGTNEIQMAMIVSKLRRDGFPECAGSLGGTQ